MAWPFNNPGGAPNKDSGFAPVPNGAAANPPNYDSVTQFWLIGLNVTNGGDTDAFIYVTDGAGGFIMDGERIPPRKTVPFEWPFMPHVGLLWYCNVPGVSAKAWGYA